MVAEAAGNSAVDADRAEAAIAATASVRPRSR